MSSGSPARQPLESRLWTPIRSQRFSITDTTPLGQGDWGVVLPGHDHIFDEEIAIKLHAPSLLAQAQTEYRKITPIDAFKRNKRRRAECSHLVYTEYHEDDDGQPFLVMPRYETFFDRLMAKTREARPDRVRKRMPKTGFSIDQLIQYTHDLAEGIAQFHEEEERAHCDYKPDNIAVNKRGRLLLADFGTATFATGKASKDPRDNMGFIYTRSPRRFAEGFHPEMKDDLFAYVSMLHKLFTDEYLFEREIDSAMREGGMDEVKRRMLDLSKTHPSDSKTYAQKLSRPEIPKDIQRLMWGAINVWSDGPELREATAKALKDHHERKWHRSIVKTVAGTFAASSLIAAGVAGYAWVNFLSPQPDYAKRVDLLAQITMRKPELSSHGLLVEREYERSAKAKEVEVDTDYSPPAVFGFKREQTLVRALADEYLRTCAQMGVRFSDRSTVKEVSPSMGSVIVHEFSQRAEDLSGKSRYATDGQEGLEIVLEYALGASVLATHGHEFGYTYTRDIPVIDLEDALVTVHLGPEKLRKAQKIWDSTSYAKYSDAIDEKDREFIQQWLYNIRTHVKKPLMRPEQMHHSW